MNNIYENNEHVVDNSTVEQTEKLSELHLEKMRYNNNSLSYILGLLGIVFSIAACFISLNSINPFGFKTVIKVILNILVLLIGFLASEKVKVYQIKFSYVMYVLGAIAIIRMLWYPLSLLVSYNKFVGLFEYLDGYLTESSYNEAVSNSSNVLGATIIGSFNKIASIEVAKDQFVIVGERIGTGYLTMNGYIRAVILFVLLGCCSGCFILSGFINQIKSTKLTNYLVKINAKK